MIESIIKICTWIFVFRILSLLKYVKKSLKSKSLLQCLFSKLVHTCCCCCSGGGSGGSGSGGGCSSSCCCCCSGGGGCSSSSCCSWK